MIINHYPGARLPRAGQAERLPYGGRRGIALVMALVLMALLTVILAFIAKEIVSQRLALEQRHHRLQAQWLARAGVEIAAARLLDNPAAFKSEVNDLIADASVQIVAERTGNDEYSITAEAQVGAEQNRPTAWSAQAWFRSGRNESTTNLINTGTPNARVQSTAP